MRALAKKDLPKLVAGIWKGVCSIDSEEGRKLVHYSKVKTLVIKADGSTVPRIPAWIYCTSQIENEPLIGRYWEFEGIGKYQFKYKRPE
ncbi:MAG: hypothetical protein EZS28_021212 [Streblomastix strix]|uniref:Uncharacterized protein n=1 Tax=Streblomastix strix TaxID=222440 RepID=A0A5J4VL98_9EUKA|nr:MAG: hypothetical protein EZS28_021212 [Streblomastix strix]